MNSIFKETKIHKLRSNHQKLIKQATEASKIDEKYKTVKNLLKMNIEKEYRKIQKHPKFRNSLKQEKLSIQSSDNLIFNLSKMVDGSSEWQQMTKEKWKPKCKKRSRTQSKASLRSSIFSIASRFKKEQEPQKIQQYFNFKTKKPLQTKLISNSMNLSKKSKKFIQKIMTYEEKNAEMNIKNRNRQIQKRANCNKKLKAEAQSLMQQARKNYGAKFREPLPQQSICPYEDMVKKQKQKKPSAKMKMKEVSKNEDNSSIPKKYLSNLKRYDNFIPKFQEPKQYISYVRL